MNGFTTLGIVEVQSPTTVSSVLGCTSNLVARRFGHNSLLEWVVRRVTDCQQLQRVVVITDAEHAEVAGQCVPPDVPIFPGSQSYSQRGAARAVDSLARFAAATRRYTADGVVRVSAAAPFVDPALIDRLVSTAHTHPQCDYISFRLGDGRPAIHSQIGVLAEFCRVEAIQRADQLASEPLDRTDPVRFICRHPEFFRLRFIPVPADLDRDDLRLAVDSDEDLENAQMIYDALGPDSLEWQNITRLLDYQPALRAKMAWLNRTAASV